MFEIKDLHVNISEVEKKIINGINLKINPGEVHAMGPNGLESLPFLHFSKRRL